jgi:general secretion pathway protein I
MILSARHTRHQIGFTLLEVLVALGIAATSLIALYTLANQLLKSAAALDNRQAALWCADNHMVTVSLLQFSPPLGESSYTCQQMNTEFTVKRLVNPTPNPLFRRVEVSVYPATAPTVVSTERLAFLAIVRLVDTGSP